MLLKFICLSWVTACIIAAPLTDEVPLERQQPTVIPIISRSEEYVVDGKFKYSYETGNGIKREETAYDKESPESKSHSDCSNEGGEDDDSGEIHVQKGSYSYTAPDGTLVSVKYIADENGFQPIITEVSHSGSQLSGNTYQNIEKSDPGKMAEYKTTNHSDIEQKNNSDDKSTVTLQNKTSSKLGRKIESIQNDIEEKTPLKFGDKLKKNEKPTKENDKLIKENSLTAGQNAGPTAIPNKENQKSTNDLVPDKEGKPDQVENIIHDEKKPHPSVENGVNEINKPDQGDKESDTKKEIPSIVENKMTDNESKPENKENIYNELDKKIGNVTEKPNQNKDKSKNGNKLSEKKDEASDQDGVISDNNKPNIKTEKSDKLKENLVPLNKQEIPFKTENKDDNKKIILDKNNTNSSEADAKALETDKMSTNVKSPKAVVKPVENKANSTKAKISIDNKSLLRNERPNNEEQKSVNESNKPTNMNYTLNNIGDIPDKMLEKPHETENMSSKTILEPFKSEIESPKNKHELDNIDQLPETKEMKPSAIETKTPIIGEKPTEAKSPKPDKHLENSTNSTKTEENSDNSDKKSAKGDAITDSKNKISKSIKAIPYKENEDEDLKLANKINVPEMKNDTKEMPEKMIEKPHENENISSKIDKEPLKSNIRSDINKEQSNSKDQSPDKKKIKPEMAERSTNNIVEKPIKEDDKINKNEKKTEILKGNQVNSADEVANENKVFNTDGIAKGKNDFTNENAVPENLLEKNNNTDMSSNKEKKEYTGENNSAKKENNEENKFNKEIPSKQVKENKMAPSKGEPPVNKESNIHKKNDTSQNGENITNKTEKLAPLSESLTKNLTKDILKKVQKPVTEVEKHEKVAEKAANESVKAAEVAENAADTAQNAAKATEEILNTFDQNGNQSRELAIDAAIKQAKLAGKAAKKAVEAAKMAEISAENAKNAAKAAEKVIELVQSSPNTKNFRKLIEESGDALKDAKKSADVAVNAASDATKQSESLQHGDNLLAQVPQNDNAEPIEINTASNI